MDVEFTTKSGETWRLSDYGVKVLDFLVESPPVQAEYGVVEGRHGAVDYGATYGQRTISIPFILSARDSGDYPLARDDLFGLAAQTEPFYVREIRSLHAGTKRYHVRLRESFDMEQVRVHGSGDLLLETVDIPFAESIGTTQDIQENGIDAAAELWGFGMGLIDDPASHIYTHEGDSFKIYNAGNQQVHPFFQYLKIVITNVKGSDNFFELRNVTNNTRFRTTEAVKDTQTIEIVGPQVTSDGLSYFRKTTHEFIELEPGWNEFEIDGALSAKVSFDFRFYYK
jgi:phage-related protein